MSWTYIDTQTRSEDNITFTSEDLGKYAFKEASTVQDGDRYTFPRYLSDDYEAIRKLFRGDSKYHFYCTYNNKEVNYMWAGPSRSAEVCLKLYYGETAEYLTDCANCTVTLRNRAAYTQEELTRVEKALAYCTKLD